MTNYAIELYATAALARAAINLTNVSEAGISVIPYREGGQSKFMVVTPATNSPM